MSLSRLSCAGLLAVVVVAGLSARAAVVHPETHEEALVNPGMGMVYYHYSNRLWAYGLNTKPGDTLDWFPGTSVAYLRVLWNDVEPKEGVFHWDIFDSILQNWLAKGKQVAFRIICCSQIENATPDWVRAAGAKGIWFKYLGPDSDSLERWEPTYDDPVFLEKLARFLKAFAARYDGHPAVAFVDVGSFGLYGEGHTGRTARLSRAETERMAKLHMELYRKLLPKTYLVVSDDVAGSGDVSTRSDLMEWAHERKIGFRDDSLMCAKQSWCHAHWGRNAADHRLPVVLETGHYNLCSARGNWRADRLLESVVAHQASYLAIQGFPEETLCKHAGEIMEINRRLGYRFVLRTVEYPESVCQGSNFVIRSQWANAGVARLPFNVSATLAWSLVDGDGAVVWSVTDPSFDFADLPPATDGEPCVRTACTDVRWGMHVAIPEWNDQVLETLRREGRMGERAFDMVKAGEYALCVSVGDRAGVPKIALPLKNGRSRRYPIGRVRVR